MTTRRDVERRVAEAEIAYRELGGDRAPARGEREQDALLDALLERIAAGHALSCFECHGNDLFHGDAESGCERRAADA